MPGVPFVVSVTVPELMPRVGTSRPPVKVSVLAAAVTVRLLGQPWIPSPPLADSRTVAVHGVAAPAQSPKTISTGGASLRAPAPAKVITGPVVLDAPVTVTVPAKPKIALIS